MFNELIAILNILVYMSVIIHVDSQKHNNKVCLKASKTLNLSEMDRWIEYESLIFVVTLLSIPMFLLFKAFVNNFLGSFKFTLAYKSTAGCADALDKNYHESRLYQTYFTNVVVAAYMIAKQNSLEKDGLQIIESRLKDFMEAMLVLNALNLAYIQTQLFWGIWSRIAIKKNKTTCFSSLQNPLDTFYSCVLLLFDWLHNIPLKREKNCWWS